MFSRTTRKGVNYARVDYSPAAGKAVVSQIQGWAASREAIPHGPGVTQSEAVQLAAHFAVLRNAITLQFRGMGAVYDLKTGAFLGTELVTESERALELLRQGLTPGTTFRALPIVGDEPLLDPLRGRKEPGLPDSWGPKLALAIDRVLDTSIAKAPKASAPPEGFGFTTTPVVWPIPVIAIVVAGAALAVVGSVAAWRYLDPNARLQIAATEAASNAYADRLATARVTGVMPPPSEVEKANAAAVEKMAASEGTSAWAIAGGVGVGVVGGAMLVGYLTR